jgi:penicillin-binding protein 1A
MQTALKGIAPSEVQVPEGVVNRGGEWFYDEFTKNTGVSSLGLEANKDGVSNKPSGEQERKSILDLFRN